jgi:hypothetical protein
MSSQDPCSGRCRPMLSKNRISERNRRTGSVKADGTIAGFRNRSGAPPQVSTTPRPDAQGLDQKSSVRRPHSDELPSRTVQSKGVSPNSLLLLSTLIDLLAVRRLTA